MAIPRVLVAEDNPDSRELVSDILGSLGYESLFAENGRDALEMTGYHQPDLVILDVNMPEMDGFAVCEALKSNPATAKIPVIMLTARADLDSRVMGLNLGADDYLAKPFHPRELIAHVQLRLRSKAITDDLREQREVLRQMFERFVAHEIVERLLSDPTQVKLGGSEALVTVFFADLEGFTTVAQHSEPQRLLEALNAYHTLLVTHIKSNNGTVDKFLGDGIMALYNTPLPQPDHALSAVRTALTIRDALPNLHRSLDPAFRLAVNFGIATGRAIVGTVGTPELMDFTAIGDTVNLASRLQRLSDNSEITISEETYSLVADDIDAERMPPRNVRGREAPVVTYLVHRLR